MANKQKKQPTSYDYFKSIRIPVAPPTSCHTSKKYIRRVKHKRSIDCE